MELGIRLKLSYVKDSERKMGFYDVIDTVTSFKSNGSIRIHSQLKVHNYFFFILLYNEIYFLFFIVLQ